MLLLDGIFIIEFLLQYYKEDEEGFRSLVSGFGNVASLILQDLMLVENQIPLSVINLIFNLSKYHNHHDQQKFSKMIRPLLLTITHLPEGMPLDVEGDHLLDLVHYVTTLSFSKTVSSNGNKNVELHNIYSAMELKEAGVVFKKAKKDETRNWLDITFKNKTIYFPELEIADETESLLKNMIAFEHYRPLGEPKYITDYAFFLHCLVNSTKDAEMMRCHGIISNLLGGNARVYELIERLGTRFQTSEDFSYLNVFCSVNQHCMHRRNRWFAVLRRNHFDNPWTAISLFAAVVLLSVAIVQTVYTVLSFYRDSLAAPSNPN